MMLQHTIHDGILVSEDGFVLDTGAPQTFRKWYMGVSIDKIAQHLGVPLKGIRGMDAFKGYVTTITDTCAHLQQTELPEGVTGEGAKLRFVQGVPVVRADVGGSYDDYIFDTGAQYSYMLNADTEPFHGESIEVKDYWPLVGDIDTLAYQHRIHIHGRPMDFPLGVPYGMLEQLLQLINVNGIIGSSVLLWYDVVLDLRPEHNRLCLVHKGTL